MNLATSRDGARRPAKSNGLYPVGDIVDGCPFSFVCSWRASAERFMGNLHRFG